MHSRHKFGLLAEYYAMLRYAIMGYLPIKHRWQGPAGEIDIIFKRGKSIIFCEVKGRKSLFDNHFVSQKQKLRLEKSANHFLAITNIRTKKVRFDLVIVRSFFNIKIYKGFIGW